MGLNVIKVRFKYQVADIPKGLEVQIPTQQSSMPNDSDFKKVLNAMGFRANASGLGSYCERID